MAVDPGERAAATRREQCPHDRPRQRAHVHTAEIGQPDGTDARDRARQLEQAVRPPERRRVARRVAEERVLGRQHARRVREAGVEEHVGRPARVGDEREHRRPEARDRPPAQVLEERLAPTDVGLERGGVEPGECDVAPSVSAARARCRDLTDQLGLGLRRLSDDEHGPAHVELVEPVEDPPRDVGEAHRHVGRRPVVLEVERERDGGARRHATLSMRRSRGTRRCRAPTRPGRPTGRGAGGSGAGATAGADAAAGPREPARGG